MFPNEIFLYQVIQEGRTEEGRQAYTGRLYSALLRRIDAPDTARVPNTMRDASLGISRLLMTNSSTFLGNLGNKVRFKPIATYRTGVRSSNESHF